VRVRREVSQDAGTKRGVACRSAHVPSPAAPVTIGRQYELALAATHVHVRFPSLRGAVSDPHARHQLTERDPRREQVIPTCPY